MSDFLDDLKKIHGSGDGLEPQDSVKRFDINLGAVILGGVFQADSSIFNPRLSGGINVVVLDILPNNRIKVADLAMKQTAEVNISQLTSKKDY